MTRSLKKILFTVGNKIKKRKTTRVRGGWIRCHHRTDCPADQQGPPAKTLLSTSPPLNQRVQKKEASILVSGRGCVVSE